MNQYLSPLTAESLQDHLDDAAILAPETPIMIVLTAEDLQALVAIPRGIGVTLPVFAVEGHEAAKSVRLPPTPLLRKLALATTRVMERRKK